MWLSDKVRTQAKRILTATFLLESEMEKKHKLWNWTVISRAEGVFILTSSL